MTSPVKHAVGTYQRTEIDGYQTLAELALDLRWSWSHRADKIWSRLDPDQWELTHNPWVLLQTVSTEKLQRALSDPEFRKSVEDFAASIRDEAKADAWFQETHPSSPLTCAAYFSMEFMLSEALPIYSGGLGNVAGDQLKAASDLGVPVIAIGLLYQQGYFRQVIDRDGNQHALFPYNDPGQLPIKPLRRANGEWLRVEIPLPGWPLYIRAWQAKVGRVSLYLLDSNDAANYPALRGITSELYGGGPELRFQQEMILGIGGWRLLEELGIQPQVCHLNEGHAAFAVLERARSFMESSGLTFEEALEVTRSGNLFTTHTAVPAGFDRFSPQLIQQYLAPLAQRLGISMYDLLALGRLNPRDQAEPFNMAYLAVRGSGAINGVSQLHGQVSRHIFASLFSRWPESEVPVGYVTNGIHVPTWDSERADDLWANLCGIDRWRQPTECLEGQVRDASDVTLWKMRNDSRQELVTFARGRLAKLLAARGDSREQIEHAAHVFDANTLTLGFARRFATYKRPDMLLQDPERLLRILNNPQRPVQLIIAGKAHPADKPGQELIKRWIQFIERPEVRGHVIFLSDYDMGITEQLVHGVDVWVNTPKRPWEACGTSGMKVLANGGLNLSELDGWWAEAYTPEVGWCLGDLQEHGDSPDWDAKEASALYDILENQIVPEFYTRDAEGIPTAWVARMRESIATLTPRFSANRAVREYTDTYYVPSAAIYCQRAENKGALGKQIVNWKHVIDLNWPSLRFSEVKVETSGDIHRFEAQVYLNDLDPKYVKVQLFATGVEPIVKDMNRMRELSGFKGLYIYQTEVPSSRFANEYTARVVPSFDNVSVPLEDAHILWQR